MPKSDELIALEERYGAHNYHPLDVVITRASGAWVWDVDGKKYMDCLAAYSAVNQGHCHPRLVKALVEQACRVALTSRASATTSSAASARSCASSPASPGCCP